MTIRKGTNIIIGQVPTDTSITSTGIYPVTGAAIYTALGLKANDSGVVHLAGTEIITGDKKIQSMEPNLQFKSLLMDTTTSGWTDGFIIYALGADKGGYQAGKIWTVANNGAVQTTMIATNRFSGSTVNSTMGVYASPTGVTYGFAPTPPATNDKSDEKIATTGWVNSPTLSTNVVHRDTAETITGLKTFTSSIRITGIDATSGSESIRDLEVYDTNGSRVGLFRAQKSSENRRYAALNVCSNTNANVGSLSISCAADGTDVKCNLPAETWGTNFHGTADYAKWADLAECYKPDEKYSVGTLIKFGGEKDITIANDKCNGVISDKPGFVLDAELEDSQPIALVGKTPIRIIGKVKKFDKIVLSEIPGVGRVLQENEDKQVIARVLENNDTFEEKLVMCVTKFNLD